MPLDSSKCENILELRPDMPGSRPVLVEECGNSVMREVFDGFRDKSAKVKVERNSGPDAGSGFFVNQGDELVTAYHVIKNTNEIKVEMPSGEVKAAHLEKFDPSLDLALLKVDGVAANSNAAVIDGSDRDRTGDYVFAMGAPGVSNDKQVLSIGTVNERVPLDHVLDQLSVSNYAGLVALARSGDAQAKQEVEAYVKNDRIVTDQRVLGGQSGGALLDTRGNVVGVITDSLGDQSLAVPASKVAEFLAKPSSYRVSYEQKNAFSEHPLSATTLHAFEFGSMLPRVNKVAPFFLAGKAALEIGSDYNAYKTATSADAKFASGRELVKDAGFIAGGLALGTGALAKIPALKYIGMAGVGVSALISTYDSLQPHTSHKATISRVDGNKAKPFLWDQTIAGTRVD